MSENTIEKVKLEYLGRCIEDYWQPTIQQIQEKMDKLQQECEEYAQLVFTCERLMDDENKTLETRVDIGMRVYANVIVRDTKHVTVKLMDDIYAQMTLEKAIKFSKAKMEIIKKNLADYQNRINDIHVRMNIALASVENF